MSLSDELCKIADMGDSGRQKELLFEFAARLDAEIQAVHDERTQKGSEALAAIMNLMPRIGEGDEAAKFKIRVFSRKVARSLSASPHWTGTYAQASTFVERCLDE